MPEPAEVQATDACRTCCRCCRSMRGQIVLASFDQLADMTYPASLSDDM